MDKHEWQAGEWQLYVTAGGTHSNATELELRKECFRLAKRVRELEETHPLAAGLERAGLDAHEAAAAGWKRRIAVLEQENAILRAANLSLVNRLETEGARVAHLESLLKGYETNARLTKAIIEQQATRIEALTAEVRSLGSDLAAAIKTGEALNRHLVNDKTRRLFLEEENAKLRSLRARLDALLSSEEVPEGLLNAIYQPSNLHLLAEEGEEAAENAWRWLRDTLRGPIDDPVPEKEANPEAVKGAWERFRELAGPPSVEAIGAEIARAEQWPPRTTDEANERLAAQTADAELGRSLVAILSKHCGERGDSEGAVETLERIIRERDAALADHRDGLRRADLRIIEMDALRAELARYREALELAGYNARPDKISFIEGERKRLEEEAVTMKESANVALRELLGNETLVPLDALSAVTAVAMRGRSVAAENKRLAQRNREGRDAEEQNAHLLEILREVEFEGEGDTCPLCGFSNPKYIPESPGHISDCRLGLALAGKAPPSVQATHPGRWISPEGAKERWPDSSEPIRTQPVVEQHPLREPAGPANGSMQPWFAGLSMEEVHLKIQAGGAPGSREPGGVIQVPRGYLDWMVSEKRPPEQPHPEVRSVGEGAAGGAFRSTYREVVPGIVTIRDIRIRVPFDLDIEFMELSGRLFWRLVHAFPSEEPQGE